MALPRNDNALPARYRAAVEFLTNRVDYERADLLPAGGHGLKLDQMRQLLSRLGEPHLKIPIVHIAGTKGKGSTAASIAAVLTAAGYRSGLFTSPHLDRMEQRIVVDGQSCSSEELAGLIEQIRPEVEAMDRAAAASGLDDVGPTYFEITMALAMIYFLARKVDIAVLEVGLGGRLDATNVCRPLVSVITSISLDHTRQLGDTLTDIAREKAGIIKRGVPVISGVTAEQPREVIREVARQQGCRLIELGRDFDFCYQPAQHLERAAACGKQDFFDRSGDSEQTIEHLSISLLGRHQAANTAVALATLGELRRTGWTIPVDAARTALAAMVWPARVEVIARRPAVVLDAAHNAASVAALLRTLDESFCVARRLLIFATSRDKDLGGMLRLLLQGFHEVAFTQYLSNPRAVPGDELQALGFALSGRRCPVYAEPAAAWDAIRAQAGSDDLICITGSFFLAADMRRIFTSRAIGPGNS